MRLDKFLSQTHPEYSRSAWKNFIKSGRVSVAGEIIREGKAEVDDKNFIKFSLPEALDFSEESLPAIYEDENVIVINKPAGLLTHSKGALNDEFTVADFFRDKTSFGQKTNRPGVIHRLDRATSGVLVGAKNADTASFLQKQFAARKIHKTYIAILQRAPKQSEAKIDAPIGRNPKKPSQFRVDVQGKKAVTLYKVLAVNQQGQALVELKPETGRTHQLRVHMAFINSPIVGDIVYGQPADRMYLHAAELELTVPGTPNQRKVFRAPLPTDFLKGFPDVKI
jgi:23S rRNA pseudouridine1911/1915/1917 synthase